MNARNYLITFRASLAPGKRIDLIFLSWEIANGIIFPVPILHLEYFILLKYSDSKNFRISPLVIFLRIGILASPAQWTRPHCNSFFLICSIETDLTFSLLLHSIKELVASVIFF